MKFIWIALFFCFYIYLILKGDYFQRAKERYLNRLFLSRPFSIRTTSGEYVRCLPSEYDSDAIKYLYRMLEPRVRQDISLMKFAIVQSYRDYRSVDVICTYLNWDGTFFQIKQQIDFYLFESAIYETRFLKSIVYNIYNERNRYMIDFN